MAGMGLGNLFQVDAYWIEIIAIIVTTACLYIYWQPKSLMDTLKTLLFSAVVSFIFVAPALFIAWLELCSLIGLVS